MVLGQHQEVRQCDFIVFVITGCGSPAFRKTLTAQNEHFPASGVDLRYLSKSMSIGRNFVKAHEIKT